MVSRFLSCTRIISSDYFSFINERKQYNNNLIVEDLRVNIYFRVLKSVLDSCISINNKIFGIDSELSSFAMHINHELFNILFADSMIFYEIIHVFAPINILLR